MGRQIGALAAARVSTAHNHAASDEARCLVACRVEPGQNTLQAVK
jgi:hypothetical protein